MYDNNVDADELLNKIAKSMNSKIAIWKDVNESIEKNISFAIIVDTDKYITDDEYEKLKQRSFIGFDKDNYYNN